MTHRAQPCSEMGFEGLLDLADLQLHKHFPHRSWKVIPELSLVLH